MSDEEVLTCFECTDSILEKMSISCLPGGVGYRCKVCQYIYNLPEYRRIQRDKGLLEDSTLPSASAVLDRGNVFKLGNTKDVSIEEMPEGIRELLTTTFAEEKDAFEGIEER